MQATQKLQLSQDQIQSLEILTMDTMQLQDFVQKEYLENPLLEYTPGRDSTFGPEDISRHYESDIPYRKTYEEAIEQDDMRRADIPSDEPEQFKRSLLHQLPPKELSSLRLHLYSYMIDCLDETGFLSIPLEEIAADTRTPLHEVERALGVLQHLEPRGLLPPTFVSACSSNLRPTGGAIRTHGAWSTVIWKRLAKVGRALSAGSLAFPLRV